MYNKYITRSKREDKIISNCMLRNFRFDAVFRHRSFIQLREQPRAEMTNDVNAIDRGVTDFSVKTGKSVKWVSETGPRTRGRVNRTIN